MKPIIEDEEKYHNTLIENCVGYFKVWDDSKNKRIPYVFRKTFRKKSKVEELKKYRGSSKGKNKANPKLLKAVQKSSKPPIIEIVDHNVLPCDLAFLEQHATMLIDFPNGGHNSEDCFNERFPSGGVSEESMRSIIAAEKLSDMIEKHKDPEDDFTFPKGFSDRDRIKYLKKNNHFVQSRWEIGGTKENIDKYALRMSEAPYPDKWEGQLWMLMPENNSEGIEEILDGNQSGEACLKVPDMPGLNTWEVPYEFHYLINPTDKETLGNELNAEPEVSSDYADQDDILRNLKNKIVRHKLITKKGNPIVDHYLLASIFKKHKMTPRLISWYKNEIKKEYKAKKEEAQRIQLGYYDFHETALKDNEGDNNNKRKWDVLLSPINFDEYDHVHQFTVGLEEKIAKNIGSFKKKNERWPNKLLSIQTHKTEKQYDDSKENKEFWKDEIEKYSAVCNVTILLVNPTGEGYTIIE